MKLTHLEMVQAILSDMDSDEVNAYDDTVESLQVSHIIKNTHDYLVSINVFPEHQKLMTLTALGDTSKPNYMQVPSAVTKVYGIQYDCRTATNTKVQYKDITYKTPMDFLDYIDGRDSSDSTVDTVLDDGASIKLLIKNDVAPTYWTSFDDEYIVFDSYDSAVDSTMQANKSRAQVLITPTYTLSDSFTPDLDDHLFPLLFNMSKAQCFEELKQQPNRTAEYRARKILTKHQAREQRLDVGYDWGPDFGR